MKPLFLAALPALALVACDKADNAPKTVEQAAAEMKEAPRMKAGKWQTSVQITKFDIPGAPPEAAEMMKNAMASAQTSESCVTKEEAARDPGEFLKKSQNGSCTFERFSVAGGVIDGKMTCSSPEHGNGRVEATMSGTMAPEAMTMNMNSVMTGGSMPGGTAEMAMTMTAKRVGECG